METLFIDWQPSVEAFSLGSLSVRWYSLMWCLGLLLSYLVAQRVFKQMKVAKGGMELTNVGENFKDVLQNTGLDAVFGVF